MNAVKYLASALLLAVLSGCASFPVSRDLERQAKPVTFQQVRADPEGTRGTIVIWDGRIINVVNETNGSSIYIVCLPMRTNEKPVTDAPSPGRFIAASSNYLDPEIYPAESRITVAGQLDGVSREQLGDIQYTYPVLDIRETHVWLQSQPNAYSMSYEPNWNVYWGPYWGPSWYWGPGWWGPGWGPGWGYRPGFR